VRRAFNREAPKFSWHVDQKYGLHCSKQFCDQSKIQAAAHSTKGVIVQKSIMKQKKGEISKLTNTATNPWMQDTRSLNNSGDLERSIKKRCHPKSIYSGVLVDDSGSCSVVTPENSSLYALL